MKGTTKSIPEGDTYVLDILLQIAPFLIVYFFLQFGVKQRNTHPLRYEWITRIICFLIICSYSLIALRNTTAFLHLDQIQEKEVLQSLALFIVSIVALLVFIPPIRRLIGRSIPIDSNDVVHTVSLSLSFLVFHVYILTAFSLEELIQNSTQGTTIGTLWTQDILLALTAIIGVGWLQKRNTKETLKRLGLVRPTFKIFFTGISFAVCFVIINLILEQLASISGFGMDPNVDKITNQQLGPLFETIPGILTLGLAAALGEELIFRGAMLPKFGLVYTSILFTLVHANYGLSVATLIVFILAIVLGVLRIRYNTTLTMVTHASYNIILGLLALLGSKLT
jgi:membrane protease YdiL (CAAX protease family)